MTSTAYKLQAEGIHKSYGSNHVLKGVTLTAKAGDVISLIGSSGSGKSTLLRCINLLEKPQQGRIVVAGEELQLKPGRNGELEPVNPKQLQMMRTKLAMVFQHFNLWAHKTVLQNIIEAPVHVLGIAKDEAVERARKYLKLVGLENREDTWPNHMSGGQQQRVAIARAIVSDPTFLICDEPTGDLDRQSAEEILGLLQQLNREHGKTIIMVTHDPKAAEYATHTVHLDKGELADAPLAH